MSEISDSGELQAPEFWRSEYLWQLEQRLEITLSYLFNSPSAKIRSHIRSFVTLLIETHRFPVLTSKALRLISQLHPLPLRWGLGHLWESELRFALTHILPEDANQAAEYLCSLGDVYLFRGMFDQAILEAESVIALSAVPLEQKARAVRILFTCLRANGQSLKADELIDQTGASFFGHLAADAVPKDAALAWLKYQQCRLEQLRERGEVDQALSLAQEMIWLDQREGILDKARTADLLTHRSTLLWVRSRYPESVSDLKQAIQLFEQADDPFNAESLKSNLGLVYWTMGELDLAEETLLACNRFFRETGSEQLLTYVVANLGLVYFARGDLDTAFNLTQEHIALAQKINFVHEYHRGRRNLGTILYYFGEYQWSIDETNASHVYYQTRGSRDAYGLDVLWIALCQNAVGNREQAFAMAQETLAQAAKLKSRVLEQVTLRCMAEFLPREERETPLLHSLEMALAMDRKLEEAAVRMALAGVYRDDRSQQQWQAGAEILKQAGAEKWLDGHSPENPPFLPLLL